MIEHAPAKINLRLRILGRDGTGYHELDTLFCALELHDDVHVDRASNLEVQVEGDVPGPPEQNLVHRAARAFHEQIGRAPDVRIRLVKRIPVSAGLGGGSSDAAATLRALNRLYGAPLEPHRLMAIGGRLGSDVPFFLCGSALARATGRGDRLTPMRPLPARPVLVLQPPFPVATAEAFGWWDSARADRHRSAGTLRRNGAGQTSEPPPTRDSLATGGADPLDAADWDGVLPHAANDFESVVFEKHPELAAVKGALERHGARPALLSGSGACVFGVFEAEEACARAAEALTGTPGVARLIATRTR